MSTQRRWIGYPLKRKEDLRFIKGKGLFIDDISLPNMVYASIVRSPYAHAVVSSIDTSRAERMGARVFTWEEIVEETHPLGENSWLGHPADKIKDYIVASGKARFQGEPVALVVSESMGGAKDAAEMVEVDYDPLKPLVDPEKALDDRTTLIHKEMGTNVAWHRLFKFGDVDEAFAAADLVVRDRFHFHRFTSAPLETSGVVATYDKHTDTFTIWSNNQRPGFCGTFVGRALGTTPDRIRFVVPDIGGGFGNKTNTYPYLALIAYAAKKTGRPVKWIEERREHLASGVAGNEVISYAELALKSNGRILGFRQKLIADEGAYMRREPLGILNMNTRVAATVYDVKGYQTEVFCVLTNKAPISPNRSYGKMQQAWTVERLVNQAARKIGVDPLEIRLMNVIRPEQMPYTTPTGAVHDGGNYVGMLNKAKSLIDYEEWRRVQKQLRQQGRYVGIGIGIGMDANPANMSIFRLVNPHAGISGDTEAALIEINDRGGILAATGSVPQGQGHETTIAQIIADEFGVNPENVTVLPRFDTLTHPHTSYSGTYASRFSVMSLGAVKQAVDKLKDKILKIAAHFLEVNKADLEIRDGGVYVKGTDRHMTLGEVAWKAWRDVGHLPEGMEPGLRVETVYKPNYAEPEPNGRGNYSLTYPVSVNIAVVEVDPETGALNILKYVAVDDPGVIINPLIAEGQIHGAWLHQYAGAMYEKMIYDDSGQLLTSTFMDYLAPTAADVPGSDKVKFELFITPSLFSAYGSRGVGEGGGAPLSALANAVEDALGQPVNHAFLTPESIYRSVRIK
ncbi:MAG: xanthine dehydrogenase family protein molybdopterin-binding subunit [Candidatus Caldarchaeum sp.]|nr:xanthine dehydrogenase family protein molybdopterin-binding subunit [Candidatus Caldarchaeum sp.]MDW8360140.1 xanthine dehydrogenase family protein molybdopterin-binding subunit [Candidatus Caldarchaeum sp.]